jgi:hypothetical protein
MQQAQDTLKNKKITKSKINYAGAPGAGRRNGATLK